jgi:hypothetical protein
MERGEIIISENRVKITPANENIWLSVYEIAKLFDVFPVKITSNIRSILKSDVLRESDVLYCHHYTNGNCVDLYNLEMVAALAFRIHSRNADIFRAWLMKRACYTCYGQSSLPAYLCDERKISLN